MATKFSIYCSVVAVLMYVSYVLSPMLSADFDIVDDHDIAQLTAHGYDFSAYSSKIKNLDFLKFPNRFYPLYLFTKYTEGYLSGYHPHYWYLMRFLLSLVCATLLTLAFSNWIPPPLAALSALVLLLMDGHAVWRQMGACENWALTWIIFGAYLLEKRFRFNSLSPSQLFIPLFFIGLSGYTKESFIPIGVMAYFTIFISGKPSHWKAKDKLSAIFLTFFIFLPVVKACQCLGTKDPQQAQAFFSLLGIWPNDATLNISLMHSVWLLPFFGAIILLCTKGKGIQRERAFFTHYLLLLFLGLGPQWLIYNNTITQHARYLFPTLLIGAAACAYSLHFLVKFSTDPVGKTILSFCALGLISTELVSGVWNRQRVERYRNQTHFYQNRIKQAVDFSKDHHQMPIVICSTGFLFERSQSISRYLKATDASISKPILLLADYRHPDPWHSNAERESERAAKNGDSYFRPSTDWNLNKSKCFAFRTLPNMYCPCDYVVNFYESEKPLS